LGANKYPRYNPHNKPTDLSNESDTYLAWNMIPNGNRMVDISGNGRDGYPIETTIISTINGMKFPGTTFDIPFPAKTDFTTCTFAYRAIIHEDEAITSDGGSSDYLYFPTSSQGRVRADAGTLIIFTGTAITFGQWYNIVYVRSELNHKLYIDGELWSEVVTHADNNAWKLNRVGGYPTYPLTSEVEDIRLYTSAKDEEWVKKYNNSFAKRVRLADDFRYDPVGAAVPKGWIEGTGTYEIKELAAGDSVLKHIDVGTKYLECTSAGSIAIPSKTAYGTWEFDLYKGVNSSNIEVGFMQPKIWPRTGSSGGQWFILGGGERIWLRRDAVVSNFFTTLSYFDWATWYSIKITRTKDGEFYVYIKGGSFGINWFLVDPTGGAGSNPVTDNTNKTSEYFVLDFDASDRIANIKITEGVIQ
jgi:hypothetical protein